MQRSAIVEAAFIANLLPMIEIDFEFEELEEKTAPQADTTYLDGALSRH
jgi:hypothetical protein